MPTGYENLRTIKDVAARSKHLGHTAPNSDLSFKATRTLRPLSTNMSTSSGTTGVSEA